MTAHQSPKQQKMYSEKKPGSFASLCCVDVGKWTTGASADSAPTSPGGERRAVDLYHQYTNSGTMANHTGRRTDLYHRYMGATMHSNPDGRYCTGQRNSIATADRTDLYHRYSSADQMERTAAKEQ